MAAAATREKSGATFLPAMKTLHVCENRQPWSMINF
jgi:hypothetical protein